MNHVWSITLQNLKDSYVSLILLYIIISALLSYYFLTFSWHFDLFIWLFYIIIGVHFIFSVWFKHFWVWISMFPSFSGLKFADIFYVCIFLVDFCSEQFVVSELFVFSQILKLDGFMVIGVGRGGDWNFHRLPHPHLLMQYPSSSPFLRRV